MKNDSIDFIQVELGMSLDIDKFMRFEEAHKYFAEYEYEIFQIYSQTLDLSFSHLPRLRRADVVFASKACLESNKWTKK